MLSNQKRKAQSSPAPGAGEPYIAYGISTRYLVSVPNNGDSRWSRYGLLAL